MATNDFHKAIEVLKHQQEIAKLTYMKKKDALEKEYKAEMEKLTTTAINLLYKISNICPNCNGSGHIHESDNDYDNSGTIVPCKKCNGTGTYIYEGKDI